MAIRLTILALSLLSLTYSTALAESRWPRFRGHDGSGIADSEKPPIEFAPDKNVLWKTPIPQGVSSPCIWDDRIFLTGVESGRLLTLCLSRTDGKILWKQPAPIQKLQRVTRANSPASPTPTTDGQRLYVLFGSYGVIAYDFDGKEFWRKPLPLVNVRHGMAASPILAAGRLIINCDQEDAKSFLIALDPADGKTIWQTPRPLFMTSHTTPLHFPHDGLDQILLAGSVRLVSYDAKDGRELWSTRGLEAVSICPSPVTGDRSDRGDPGLIYAMSFSTGQGFPSFDDCLAQCDKNNDGKLTYAEGTKVVKDMVPILDKNRDSALDRAEWDAWYSILKLSEHGLFAVRPGRPGQGDVTETNTVWKQNQSIEVTSPLYYRGRIHTIRSGGFASCYNAKTGHPLYLEQRIGADGQYFASPIAADGKIYLASTLGVVTVIESADTLRILAKNDLSDPISATPAIADNKIYLRTSDTLWSIGR